MNNKKIISVLLLLFFITNGFCSPGARQVALGDSLAACFQHDKALCAYKPVITSYNPDMSRKQINDCLDAIFGSCNANLFKANYLASFGLLSQTEDIMNLFGISDPRLPTFYSAFYLSLNSQVTTNGRYLNKLKEYARKSLYESMAQDDSVTAYRAFGNLIVCQWNYGVDSLWISADI